MAIAAGMQKKTWHVRRADDRAPGLARALRVSPVLAQVLINRDIADPDKARAFLSPKLTDLIEPDRLSQIGRAVERIRRGLTDGELITVYGDYDVDGITSVTILWHLLTMLGGRVEYYIPHRLDEGYGLNDEAIRQLAQNGTRLIITVDCGITAVSQAELAAELGMDMIITDHHQAADILPQAEAIVHPRMEDYPNPDSAGAMVALKLAWALVNTYKAGGQTSSEFRRFLLDATTLAAMGTIADVVDLRGENRVLTSYGLKTLGESNLMGIRALLESADLGGKDMDSYHVAFRLAPMLNAAGRMGHARLAVELLTSDSEVRCAQIAGYLKDQNRLRQQYQRKIFSQAADMITAAGLNHPDHKTIVLADEKWHGGIVGIVASRVIDKYFRPTIMISTANSIAQGSARSVEGFDILAAIRACSEHLVSFGGHAMAAGLKIEKDNIAGFTAAIEEYAQQNLDEEKLVSKLNIDRVCSISDMSHSVVKELSLLEPTGQGNPKPLFATRGVRWMSPPRRVGAKGDHLQIAITDNTASVRCIGFGMGKLEKKLLESDGFNVAYEPQINTYNGNSSVQFVLADIQFE
ncbi:MAG: single-stranded-DNA-specific exonuclease RecJ [Planctomycetes bacterium]|nr:single-stranded-DNA-specific exonuclease RecJ [Planctomycetota bacterium]